MNAAVDLSSCPWEWLVWTLLALAGGAALLAVCRPSVFQTISVRSSRWIDIDRFARKLDVRIEVDQRILPHSRFLGALSVVASGVLAVFSLKLPHAGQWVVLPSLALVGATGALAMISPRLFSRLAHASSLWVDFDGMVDKMQRRIDIDHYVLRHCRLFGVVVLAAVAILATVLISTT